MNTRVKICGLTRPEDVIAVEQAGADYAGLVFFEKSPRNVTLDVAGRLARLLPKAITRVALVVDADDRALGDILDNVQIDLLQLHGKESVARVAEVKARFGVPVMKAVGVAAAGDLIALDQYAEVADQVLVDAKPPKGADLPGGNGLSFDWSLLSGREWRGRWMLAGGLTPQNVAEAVRRTGASQVDVSSGVEAAPGVKDAGLIRDFVQAARGLCGD